MCIRIPYTYTRIYSDKCQLNRARCYCFSFSKVETAWRGRKLHAGNSNVFRKPLYYIYVNSPESPSELSPRGRCRPEVLPFETSSIKYIISDIQILLMIIWITIHVPMYIRRNYFYRFVVILFININVVIITTYNTTWQLFFKNRLVNISLLLLLCVQIIV